MAWTVVAVTVIATLLCAGFRRVRHLGARLPGSRSVQIMLAAVLFWLLIAALTIPFRWIAFQRSRADGVSVSSDALWLRDFGLSTLIGGVSFAITACVVAFVIRRFAQTWPLLLAGLAAAVIVVTSLLLPVFIQPLFLSTHPLPAGPVRTMIEDLAAKEGVHLDDIAVAHASERTTADNAQVIGFGPTERLILDDTLLHSMNRREVAAVVGHELGHAAHHDVLVGTILAVLGLWTAVGLSGLLIIRRGWMPTFSGPSGVPLLLAMLVLGGYVVSPIESGISRAIESRADRASISVTQDSATFETVQKKLALSGKADPTPPNWSQFWWGTHPTVLERISLARKYLKSPARQPDSTRDENSFPP